MKALVFHHPGKVQVDEVEDPKIEDPQDIILRVTTTAICGSDLHIYNGFFPQLKDMVRGHEFMGVVEETGSAVTKIAKGDRVVVPFPIACGACFFCNHELPGHCEKSNPDHYGPEGGLLTEKGGAKCFTSVGAAARSSMNGRSGSRKAGRRFRRLSKTRSQRMQRNIPCQSRGLRSRSQVNPKTRSPGRTSSTRTREGMRTDDLRCQNKQGRL